jgi:hypothetical protein
MTNILLKKLGMSEKGPAQEVHKWPPPKEMEEG